MRLAKIFGTLGLALIGAGAEVALEDAGWSIGPPSAWAQEGKEGFFDPSGPTVDPETLRPATALVKYTPSRWPHTLYDEPQELLETAVREQRAGDRSEAADRIEKAADFARIARERSRLREIRTEEDEDAEDRLKTAAEQMDALADRVESGAASDPAGWRVVFARYLLALARHHALEGAQLSLAQHGDVGGTEFQAAANDAQHALKWAGREGDTEAAAVLRETERVGGELIRGRLRPDREMLTGLLGRFQETVRRIAVDLDASPAAPGRP
jgi:hypothetical protein